MSELRYHPFLDEWVITATHRQERTFFPPDGYCPLCPTVPGGFPTEIPFPDYEIVVFENKFPSLATPAPEPGVEGSALMPVRPSAGVCEVVCYTPDHDATFADLPLQHVRNLARVWRDRFVDLAGRPGIEYVMIFENKGREIGVTLTHPHGQIYAYPFVPPAVAQRVRSERQHHDETGRSLWADWLEEEAGGPREVWRNAEFVAIVPFFARYPYEVWVVPFDPLGTLGEMGEEQLDALAEALHEVARRYDALFGFSLPYLMAMHHAPHGHLHGRFFVEFLPPHRSAEKLKYLAGSESCAGAFINDTLPEETAARLRSAGIGDRGSEIGDQGSEIGDQGSGIR